VSRNSRVGRSGRNGWGGHAKGMKKEVSPNRYDTALR
jgi:hypothetical protein